MGENKGPYSIRKVYDNATVSHQFGKVADAININQTLKLPHPVPLIMGASAINQYMLL
jgi:hypothetical protein